MPTEACSQPPAHHVSGPMPSDAAQALHQHLATVREQQGSTVKSRSSACSASHRTAVEQPHTTASYGAVDSKRASRAAHMPQDVELNKLAEELSAEQACVDEVIKLASILWDSGILLVPNGRQQLLPASLLLRLLDRSRLAQLRNSMRMWWHKCSMQRELQQSSVLLQQELPQSGMLHAQHERAMGSHAPVASMLQLLDRGRLAQLRTSMRVWWHKCSMERELQQSGMLRASHAKAVTSDSSLASILHVLDRGRLSQLRTSMRMWWHKCSMERELQQSGVLRARHAVVVQDASVANREVLDVLHGTSDRSSVANQFDTDALLDTSARAESEPPDDDELAELLMT
eukprot:841439-Amphidinium_carterae.1